MTAAALQAPSQIIPAHLSVIGLAFLLAWSASSVLPAAAGTPTSCESLTSFGHPDTTINSAQSQAGGTYVAPDAWHLAFTNLPPYCEVQATIAPTPDSSIKVRVWMPTQRYNGRYLGTGNGGYAGGSTWIKEQPGHDERLFTLHKGAKHAEVQQEI